MSSRYENITLVSNNVELVGFSELFLVLSLVVLSLELSFCSSVGMTSSWFSVSVLLSGFSKLPKLHGWNVYIGKLVTGCSTWLITSIMLRPVSWKCLDIKLQTSLNSKSEATV